MKNQFVILRTFEESFEIEHICGKNTRRLLLDDKRKIQYNVHRRSEEFHNDSNDVSMIRRTKTRNYNVVDQRRNQQVWK